MINLATGLEDAERVMVAFLVATAALEQGKQVTMFLTKDAVELALPGHAQGVACEGCPPIERLFEQYAEGGGELLALPDLLQRARARGQSELVPNARVGRSDAALGMDRRGDALRCFSYWKGTVDAQHGRSGGRRSIDRRVAAEERDQEDLRLRLARSPRRDFIFPTGRAWAEDLGYPDELANVPEAAVESFAGVANPWQLGRLAPGERVLDLGSGAGTDSLVAAQMVGEQGHVTGIDMTPEMLAKARAAAAEMGAANVEFVESEAERLPFPDGSFDVVDLERRHRPDPGQGRRLLRALPRARARRADADRRRHDPEPGQRGGPAQHRPLDRLNCRGAAGSSVRQAPRAARLRADRDRPARRHLRPLEVRGHPPQGAEVRRPRHDGEGVQTERMRSCR